MAHKALIDAWRRKITRQGYVFKSDEDSPEERRAGQLALANVFNEMARRSRGE